MDETGVRWLIQEDDDGPRDRHDFFAAVKAFFGLTDSVEDLVRTYRADYPSCYRRDEASIAVVTQLSRLGLKIAVVTNGEPSQAHKVRLIGVADVVDAVCISSVVGALSPPGQSLWRRPVNAAYLSRVGWSVTARGGYPRRQGGWARLDMAPPRPHLAMADLVPDFVVSTVSEAAKIITQSVWGGPAPDQTPLAPNAHSPVLWATNPTVGLPLCSEGGLKVRYAKPSSPRHRRSRSSRKPPALYGVFGTQQSSARIGFFELSHPDEVASHARRYRRPTTAVRLTKWRPAGLPMVLGSTATWSRWR